MTLSITHLQAILEPVDGPWLIRLIVPAVGLSTRPFISSTKANSRLCAGWLPRRLTALRGAKQWKGQHQCKLSAEAGVEGGCIWGLAEISSVFL